MMTNKKEKIYPSNKIILKKETEIISHDYVDAAAQLLFNFVLAMCIKNNSNDILMKPSDYFEWRGIVRPQGKEYIKFYKDLETLKKTRITALELSDGKKIKYEWPLVAQTQTFYTSKNKTDKIKVSINPYLMKYYIWHRANIVVDINETKKLSVKYSYRLYEFLSLIKQSKNKNKIISIVDLRRILTAPSAETHSRFLKYLKAALKNLKETTNLKFMAQINVKNKKALHSAMIKFVNLDFEKSDKIFEFLQYVDEFKKQNEDAELYDMGVKGAVPVPAVLVTKRNQNRTLANNIN